MFSLNNFFRKLSFSNSETPSLTDNTFIVWEPSSVSHGEVVPGYVKYLRDLGFDVLVLMTPARLAEGLFCRYHDERVIHAGLSQKQIRRFLQASDFSNVPGVIITTGGKLYEYSNPNIDLAKIFSTRFPKKTLIVEHDVRPLVDKGIWDSKYITLRRVQYKNVQTSVVNPHYFGRVSVKENISPIVKILMVGAVRAKRGSQGLVYRALTELVESGTENFELRVVGKRGFNRLPSDLGKKVKILGRLSFEEMYREVEESDFILTSFQRSDYRHNFYFTSGTSGAFQLSYGFSKPLIIHHDLAEMCELNRESSVTYTGENDFSNALRIAVEMAPAEYQRMVRSVRSVADNLYQKSLRNLRSILDE